jgi:hypothetical protein
MAPPSTCSRKGRPNHHDHRADFIQRFNSQSPSPRPNCLPRATKGGLVPKARLCRHHEDQHCGHAAKMEKVISRILASYRYLLTDRRFEVPRVQQIRRILEGCDRKSRSWGGNGFPPLHVTSWEYFRQFKQLYSSVTAATWTWTTLRRSKKFVPRALSFWHQ